MLRIFTRLTQATSPLPRTRVHAQPRHFSTSRTLLNSLVIADHDNKVLSAGTLNTVSCAKAIGKPVDVIVLGHQCSSVVSACASIEGVSKVLFADHKDFEHPIAEYQSQVILKQITDSSYTHVLAAASSNGKNLIPRLGAYLDVQPVSEVQSVVSEDIFIRPIYAGNALQKVQSLDKVKLLTVRTTAFPPATKASTATPVSNITVSPSTAPATTFVSLDSQRSERPELTSADRVVSGGRALKSSDNFSILYALADQINAAVGASRAAVDAGFAPNDMQVGQTGKVVAPSLYIAVGISGAIQHLAGMKDSKVIVAINTDEEAPIFQVADFGLVADLFKAVPELTAALKK